MKWKRRPSEFSSEKTFLIIKDDLESLGGKADDAEDKDQTNPRSTKSKSAANTGTWPPKIKKGSSSLDCAERPKTANLEKPSVLDPNLVDKLDMSLLSKELLSDSMTRIQRGAIARQEGGTAKRRQSVPVGEQRDCSISSAAVIVNYGETSSNSGILSLARQKRKSFEPLTDSEAYEKDPFPDPSTMKKQTRLSFTNSNEALVKRFGSGPRRLDDNNNKNKVSNLSTVRKKNSKTTVKSDIEVFTAAGAAKCAPEPCKTCGRPDQPERFHSHPKGIAKVRDSLSNVKSKVSIPKTVQKPVALNFRSEKSKCKTDEAVRVSSPKVKVVPQQDAQNVALVPQPSAKKGPRTVTCYICSREFGTASFPIHEPKCMQKWERENNALPLSQRRPPPQRPTVAFGHQDWNKVAWEQSQAQLLPCQRCGRTFLPDRLPVHQKSCKAPIKNLEPTGTNQPDERIAEKATPAGLRGVPATILCQICGRNYGTRSIKIHEQQCLKRWHAENDSLPANQRKKDPPKREESSVPPIQEIPSGSPTREMPPKKTIPCYICGRDFGTTSIAIHQPHCLKKWHQENEKLPPHQRRKEPQKPDIVFTRDHTGAAVVDHAATAEANWRSHLGQLVPCKRCGRTFNPDRVEVHERSCKGNR